MAKGLITQAGAADIQFGSPGEGAAGKLIIHVTVIANPATVKARVIGGGAAALVALQVKNRTTDAMAATIAAAGIYEIDASGLDIWITFGAGNTTYVWQFVAA